MKVGRQDVLYKWLMDELPKGVKLAVRGIPATWSDDHFVLIPSGQIVSYGGYRLRDITVNGVDIRQFHKQSGTCKKLPEWVAQPVATEATASNAPESSLLSSD